MTPVPDAGGVYIKQLELGPMQNFVYLVGDPVTRPLLPEHDLSKADALLVPKKKQTIMLIANGSRIEYWRDGVRLLQYEDKAPYQRGWFAIRTVQSHLRIERLRVHRL